MSDSIINLESSEETPTQDAPAEFGLVDVIEAFTAMRHEWRGQTKESRETVESIELAAGNIKELETKLLAQVATSSTDETRKLVELLASTDSQLTRTVEAATQSETTRLNREASEASAIQQQFDGMSALGRWFARPLMRFVTQQRQSTPQTTSSPTVEGLNVLLARLRRTMKEHRIERVETMGQPFDAETMNAIGTLVSHDRPAGHVAEQLSPGYRWRGNLFRFADVRVTN